MKSALLGSVVAGLAIAIAASVQVRAQAQEAATAADSPGVVSAVWMERDVTLHYMGFTSYYSCEGLRGQVRRILQELGARPGFKVTMRNCIEPTGPEWSPSVRIVAALPVEATPEVLAELASDASERELAARVQGKSSDEATAQFPARPKRVEFVSGGMSFLKDGDCELMEQMRDRAFGPLGVKVIDSSIRCVPRQVSIGSIRMTVEVLEPVPAPNPTP
jgi:hypothetical protein